MRRELKPVRWVGVVLALLTFGAACGPTEGDEEFFDSGVEVPLEGLCVDGCNRIEECGQCDADEAGNCYDRIQCIQVCDQFGGQDRFACVMDSSGGVCNVDIPGCLDGSAITPCHRACGLLEECSSCSLDESGRCRSLNNCLSACEAPGDQAASWQCLADLGVCDDSAISDCFSGPGPDPGDDDCGRGCAALDACELCLPGDDDNCLSVLECAGACRGADDALDAERARCLAGLQVCDEDAVNACLDGEEPPVGDDECARGCVALDDCDLCLTDPQDECISPADCAVACRENDGINPAAAACLETVAACDEAEINACFDIEPPIGDDPCALACQHLDGCGICLTDEDDECYEVSDCAAECRDNALISPEAAQCLAESDSCEDPAIDACFDAVPPEAPSCEMYCQRVVECAETPDGEIDAALAACNAECADANAPEVRTCVVAAESCEAAADCDPDPDPDPDPEPDAGVDPAPDAGPNPDAGPEADAGI